MGYALDLAEICIDTREQLPYYAKSPRTTLATGDFSLVGYEHRIAIERKSVPDAFGSVGKGRWRFMREWGRLALMDWAAVVIEGTRDEVLDWAPPVRRKGHRLSGQSVIGSLDIWSIFYGVPVHFEHGRMACKRLVPRLLKIAREYVDADFSHKHNRAICVTCGGGDWVPHRTGCDDKTLIGHWGRHGDKW